MAETKTLAERLDALPVRGGATALLVFERERIRTWSFQDLDAAVGAGALALDRRGVGPGGRVALLGPPRFAWIAAALAVLRRGAVVVPVDPQLEDAALAHVLEDADAAVVLADADAKTRVERLVPAGVSEVVSIEALVPAAGTAGASTEPAPEEDAAGDAAENAAEEARAETPRPAPEAAKPAASDVAVLFYTSGTTGPPKGVPLTYGNLDFALATIHETGLVSTEDRVLVPLPLHHVYPFVIGALGPLALGIPVILPHALTGPEVVRALVEGDATIAIGVPRLYRAMLQGVDDALASRGPIARTLVKLLWAGATTLRRRLGVDAGRLLLKGVRARLGPSLRILASGGSALDPRVAARLQGLGFDVAIGYGLTETSPLITINPPGLPRLDAVGRAVPGVEIRVDPSAEPGREGEGGSGERDGVGDLGRGELLVRGPNVFGGYRNLPDATREAFTEDGWFRTGDLATIDDEGWVRLVGRVGTMIVTEGGENVDPETVEHAYGRHEAIGEIAVLGRDGGLVGLVVPQGAGKDAIARARRAVGEVSRTLPSYQRLQGLAFTRDALPRTRLGKIQRHLVEERWERARRGEDGAADRAGPVPLSDLSDRDRGLLEHDRARAVWNLLAERFPDARVAPDADLRVDLGIDSLAWLGLTLDIGRRAGVELDERTLARVETVRDLLEAVIGAGDGGESASLDAVLTDPWSHLEEETRDRLSKRGRTRLLLARALFAVNRRLLEGSFRLRVARDGPLPAPPFLLAPNHASYLDAPALAAALSPEVLDRTWWAGWTGIMLSGPALRAVSRIAPLVLVDPRRGAAAGLAAAAAVLARGENLVWFPEGARSDDGRLQSLRPGIGLLLAHRPVPVVPVLIDGTHEAWPTDRRRPRRRPVSVRIGRPLDVARLEAEGRGETADARITDALHRAMAAQAEAGPPRR